jgi:hypothetical protein
MLEDGEDDIDDGDGDDDEDDDGDGEEGEVDGAALIARIKKLIP